VSPRTGTNCTDFAGERFGANASPSPPLNSSPLLSPANEHGRSSAMQPPPAAADPSSLDDARARPGTGSGDCALSQTNHVLPAGISRDTRSPGGLKRESGDGSQARQLKGAMRAAFLCKISAKHLPQLDVFLVDPVCFVREVSGAWPRIIRKSYNNPAPPPPPITP